MSNGFFDNKSRYKDQPVYQITDGRGRQVTVVMPPPPPEQTVRGYHVRRQGQRLDHLAYQYLRDPAGFWRICEMNAAILPEQLSDADEVAIPE